MKTIEVIGIGAALGLYAAILSKKKDGAAIGAMDKWQLFNGTGYFYRNLNSGSVQFSDSMDKGYIYTFTEAMDMKDKLHADGYTNIEITRYVPYSERNAIGAGKYTYYKVIQQNWGYGWDDVDFYQCDSTGWIKDQAERELFKTNLKLYKTEPGQPFPRVILRKEKVEI